MHRIVEEKDIVESQQSIPNSKACLHPLWQGPKWRRTICRIYATYIWREQSCSQEGYIVSSDSFDPNISSLSNVEWHKVQREEVDYGSSMPSKLAHYMSDEDTSSNSGNGFKNLAND